MTIGERGTKEMPQREKMHTAAALHLSEQTISIYIYSIFTGVECTVCGGPKLHYIFSFILLNSLCVLFLAKARQCYQAELIHAELCQ